MHSSDAMCPLVIMFSLCFAATAVWAAPRGLTACPVHWVPEGEDANGCPSRCLNRATREKIHLIVRYTLKGALLKGCVQCEERWIENTDCVMVLCPENRSSCSQEDDLRPASTPPFQLSSRGLTTGKARNLSLELFKELYPVEIMTQDLPGGGVVRVYMPTQGPHIPRYTRTPQIPLSKLQEAPTVPPTKNAEIAFSNEYSRPDSTTESLAEIASAANGDRAQSLTVTLGISSSPTETMAMNQENSGVPVTDVSTESTVGNQPTNVENATEITGPLQSTIPPPAPAPRVKSRYANAKPPSVGPR